MHELWQFVVANKTTLSWLGGGAVTVAGGAWAVIKFFLDRKQPPTPAQQVTGNSGFLNFGNINNSPITINQTDNPEVLAILKELRARYPEPAAPGAEKRLGEAVANIAQDAAAGDGQLATALNLLRDNKIAEATVLLRRVAEDRAARIQKDRKDAATAYRNLGAIAGLGDPKAALEAYEKAVEYDPDDPETLFWLGWLKMDRGSLDSAERNFRQVLTLTEHDPDAWAARWARIGLGDILTRRGNLAAALRTFQDSLAATQRLAKTDPTNREWQRDLSVSHNRIGDVQRRQGDAPAALSSYQAGLDIRQRLAKTDTTNTEWQRDLSVSQIKIGDVQAAQGDAPAALISYQASLDIRQRLAKTDPTNTGWQRDLSVSHDRIGDVQADQGDAPAALSSYQASLDIAERLAKTDPTNTEWQRDLSVSHEKVGDVQTTQGDAPAALISYQAGLAIAERLAKTDPTNTEWQRDLAVSHNKIGDVQATQGDATAALSNYQAGLDIPQRLAKTYTTKTL